jgi:hypothetical protein
MSKCCFVTWLLIFASCLWITGLTIGIIGAVNWAPLKPFLDNSKPSTCTLVEYEYKSSRCTKWGNCLIVNWEVTHPGLKDPNAVVTAWITEKKGLGYNDASKLVATRKVGDVVSCLIDARTETSGYFTKPGSGYFAQLVIGWIFFFIGTVIWIIFFMEVCCGIKVSKMRCRSLKCCCSGSSSKYSGNVNNPLYNNTSSLYGNTNNGGSSRNSIAPVHSRSGSIDSRSASVEAELTPIPPAQPAVDSPPSSGSISSSGGAAGGAGAAGYNDSSSSGDDYGAGAGVTN